MSSPSLSSSDSTEDLRPPTPSYQDQEQDRNQEEIVNLDKIMPTHNSSAMDTSSAELPIEQQKVFPSTSTSMDVSMTWMTNVGSFSGPHKNIMEPREFVERFETAIMQGNWTNKVHSSRELWSSPSRTGKNVVRQYID